jgi:hypothetical protein
METPKAIFKNAWPYQLDKMNLPVKDLETAIPFYEIYSVSRYFPEKISHINQQYLAGTRLRSALLKMAATQHRMVVFLKWIMY